MPPSSLRDTSPTLGEVLISFVYKAYAEASASKTFLSPPKVGEVARRAGGITSNYPSLLILYNNKLWYNFIYS